MEIDVNGVSITLTQDQLEQIARQTGKFNSYKDIKTLEDAYNHLGKVLPNYSILRKREIALRHLEVVVEAIRSFTNWKPDFNNDSQYKYWSYFKIEGGFSCWYTDYTYASTAVPSALLVESSEQAEFLGKTFLDLFKDYILEEKQ
jgi:hypothetical protein